MRAAQGTTAGELGVLLEGGGQSDSGAECLLHVLRAGGPPARRSPDGIKGRDPPGHRARAALSEPALRGAACP